jgi:hypothetical protein
MLGRLLLLLSLWCAPVAWGAFETTRAMVSAAPTIDPLSPSVLFWHVNPAALVQTRSLVCVAHGRPFGLKELDLNAVGFVHRRSRLTLAMGVVSLGSSALYRESDLSASATYGSGRTVSAGVTLHLLDLRFGQRFSGQRFGALDAGLWLAVPGGSGVGASVADWGAPNIGGRAAVQPRYRVCAYYRYSPRLALRAGLERASAWTLALGETVRIAHTLHLGAEVVSDPLRLVARARFSLDPIYVEFTFRDHPDLGGDHLLVVGWNLK